MTSWVSCLQLDFTATVDLVNGPDRVGFLFLFLKGKQREASGVQGAAMSPRSPARSRRNLAGMPSPVRRRPEPGGALAGFELGRFPAEPGGALAGFELGCFPADPEGALAGFESWTSSELEAD